MRPVHVWRVFIFGILGALVTFEFMLFTGFCFSDMRYIGNAEFIERALVYRASAIKELSNTISPSREEVLNYLKKNPNCCRVEGSAFFLSSSIKNRIFGFKSTWVRVVHRHSSEQTAISPGARNFHEAYIGLNRCGTPFRRIRLDRAESYAKTFLRE